MPQRPTPYPPRVSLSILVVLAAFFVLPALSALPTLAAAAPIRYQDDVFAGVAESRNILYGKAKAYNGLVQDLHLDLYEPQGDTANARPLIVWIHGGGFSSGSKDDGDVVRLCRLFARKGYVTASIDYRLDAAARIANADSMTLEAYRAVLDARAAVRFLRAHKPVYRIDDTRILVGGTSAGGVIALLYAYLDPSEVPSWIDVLALGTLKGPDLAQGTSSAINGIINCWGGLADSTWLGNGALPVLSFHGTLDATMPYERGYALGNPALAVVGSAVIHRVLTRAGVPSILKPFAGMGHGIPLGDARADTLAAMTRDFAWDVLYGGGPSPVKAGMKYGPGPEAAPSVEPRRIRADGKTLESGSNPRSLRLFHPDRKDGD